MLFGLIRPDAGTIRVLRQDLGRGGIGVLDGVAGFIESPKFYPYLTGRRTSKGSPSSTAASAPAARGGPRLVDLTDRADEKVGGYSYGMRQRLGVAASLLREPEAARPRRTCQRPGPRRIRDMRALVKRLARSGLTVLLSSHDMDEVEEICDNVTILKPRLGRLPRHHRRAAHDGPRPRPPARDHRRRARARPRRQPPRLQVARDPEAALVVTGPQSDVSAYVAALVRADVDLLAFTPTRTPLEALFFMLTDDRTHVRAASRARATEVPR